MSLSRVIFAGVLAVVGPSVASAEPLVLGHRGTGTNTGTNPFPENTIVSLVKALEEGADGVELDVMLAADNGNGDPYDELVVMHDESLTRTTTCASAAFPSRANCVETRTLESIRECVPTNGAGETSRPMTDDEGNVLPDGFVEQVIPTLAESLDAVFAADPEAIVNVEIKSQPPTDSDSQAEGCNSADPFHQSTLLVVELLAERYADRRGQVVLSSFDPTAMAIAELLAPDLETAYLVIPARDVSGSDAAPDARVAAVLATALGLDGVHPHFDESTAEAVGLARDLGLAVRPWTVNELPEIERLTGLGVDAIITDDPPVVP